MKKIYKRIWFQITAGLLLLFLILLMILPYGIGRIIRYSLTERGFKQVMLEDIDLNLFTGTFVIKGLSAASEKEPLLKITEARVLFSWLPLLKRRFVLDKVTVRNTEIRIEESANGILSVGGVPIPYRDGKNTSGAHRPLLELAMKELEIVDSRTDFRSPYLNAGLSVDRATFTLMTGQDDGAYLINFEGKINDAPLLIDGRAGIFAEEPGVSAKIQLMDLPLEIFADLAASRLKMLAGSLSLNLKVDIGRKKDGALLYGQEGNLSIRNLKLNSGLQDLATENLNWEGDVRMTVPEAPDLPRISASGYLQQGALTVKIPQDNLLIRHQSLSWRGELNYGRQEAPERFEMTGTLSVSQLGIEKPDIHLLLLGMQALDIRGIDIRGKEHLFADEMRLQGFTLAQAIEQLKGDAAQAGLPLLFSDLITVRNSTFSDLKHLTVDQAELTGLASLIRRDSTGHWHLIEDLLALRSKETGADEKTSKTPSVKIAMIRISEKSRLYFKDEKVSPPFASELNITKALLENIDSGHPDKPSHITVEGRVGKYSTVSLKGSIHPFAERLTIDMKGRIQAFDMPPLSSYVSDQLGYDLATGHLNASVDLKIDGGRLDGKSSLTIDNMKVTPQKGGKMEQARKRLTMPLEMALSILRDKNNQVRLELPFHGTLDDPRFDVSDMINQALGKAVKTASVGYLKYIFQPYGTAITLVQLAGKAALKIRLDPVVFSPGSEILEDQALAYLERLARIMQERPGVSVSVCGKAIENDREHIKKMQTAAMQQTRPEKAEKERKKEALAVPDGKLNELADLRARAIKEHMVTHHGIAAERLFLCQPEIDPKADALPRAELLI